jgi:hypothetical protein
MTRLRGTQRAISGWAVTLALANVCGVARAQEVTPEPTARRGEISITYQYAVNENLHGPQATVETAPVRTQLIDFNVRRALNERWALEVGLPVISRKTEGPPIHNPMRIIPPHPESEFIDDGHYNTFVQDLRLGARYLLLEEPFIIEPYLMIGTPASDYPFFGASAPGEQVNRQEIGSTFAYRPPFLKWYFSMQVGYQNVEKTLGVNKDAMRVDAQAMYFVNPKIAVQLFISSKNGHGASPRPNPDLTSEFWYNHDRLTRNNYVNMGLGVNWLLDNRNMLNVSVIDMVRAEDIFALRGAASITLSRTF